MEKFTPTYNLEEFKKSDSEFTKTALKTSKELGFEESDVRDVILTMERKHFYKSMTSYANHKIWQDVYHVPCGNLILYVKFTQNIISEFTLLSFKILHRDIRPAEFKYKGEKIILDMPGWYNDDYSDAIFSRQDMAVHDKALENFKGAL